MTTPTTTRPRLEEILAQLRRHPSGMTSSELAEVLGVDASTIRREFARLAISDVGIQRKGRRYILDFRRAQRPLRLSADEVLALYLACRLLAREQGDRNQHAETAMRKLATVVRDDAPRLARYLDDAAASLQLSPLREGVQPVLEALTQAISFGQVILLHYRDQHGALSERRFHPYALEPFGETNGCYAIGFDETRSAMRTFRLDRIDVITLTADTFDVPANFNPSRLFAEAWGVVWTGADPQSVVLRFTGDAATRVHEGIWHPSQRFTIDPDGSCLVTFRVSEPREMRRWLLQWGASVEVLSPPALRAEMAAECARIGNVYRSTHDTHDTG